MTLERPGSAREMPGPARATKGPGYDSHACAGRSRLQERWSIRTVHGMSNMSTEAANATAGALGLPTPTLIRHGSAAVFRAGNVTLRVSRGPEETVRRLATIHAVLHGAGLTVPRVLTDPMPYGPYWVTALEWLEESGDLDWVGVGQSVADLHTRVRVDDFAAAGVSLGQLVDTYRAKIASRATLAAAAGRITQSDAKLLWSWSKRLSDDVDADSAERRDSVLHADLHPGNLVQTMNGVALIDFERISGGDARWEHGALLASEKFFGSPTANYDLFADGYGRSLREDQIAHALVLLRALSATAWLFEVPDTDGRVNAEIANRMRHWRGEDPFPRWRAV